ncbi:MAG: hypothetical protein ACI81W_001039, partial [Saprospiraceae bacterium]
PILINRDVLMTENLKLYHKNPMIYVIFFIDFYH